MEEKSNGNKKEEKWPERVKKIGKSERSVKRYQWFVFKVALVLVIFWILFFKIIGLINMPNTYMSPNVEAGDLLLYYRLDKTHKNGDVVVYRAKDGDTETVLVGRIVAGPSDTVEVSGSGHLYVNYTAVTESKASDGTYPYEDKIEYPLTLKEGEYFILGDARKQSLDSRYYGVIGQEDIIGNVINLIRRQNI